MKKMGVDDYLVDDYMFEFFGRSKNGFPKVERGYNICSIYLCLLDPNP